MTQDMTTYSVIAARPAIRPVASSPDRSGFGARFASAPQKPSTDAAAPDRPRAVPALGDARAAHEVARLAKRYESAAKSAAPLPNRPDAARMTLASMVAPAPRAALG